MRLLGGQHLEPGVRPEIVAARKGAEGMPDIPLQRLFVAFLHLGATAYGGPAMMAYLKSDLVDKRRWLSDQEFKEGMALCQ